MKILSMAIVSVVSSLTGVTDLSGKLQDLPRREYKANYTVSEESREYETLEVVGKTDEVEVNIEQLILNKARETSVSPETALRIAKCESSLNPLAKNPNSTATGLYQFLDGTWEWIGAEAEGLDRTNPEHSIDMFLKWYPKNPQWWLCK